MPFFPPPSLSEGALSSPLVNPALIENDSSPELKLEPRSPDIVLNENIFFNTFIFQNH